MSAVAPDVSLQQLRPLAIGEILDVAAKIVWRNAGTLLRVVFFVVFPIELLSSFIKLSATPSDWTFQGSSLGFSIPTTEFPVTTSQRLTYESGQLAAQLLILLAGILATGACFRAITSAYLAGSRSTWRESLGFSLRRFHSILWVACIVGFLTILGFVACIVPGVYLYACFAVSIPVLLTEDARGFKAIGRSRSLVKGFWWRTFGIVFLGGLLAGFIALVLDGIVVGLTTAGASATSLRWLISNTVAGTVASMVTTPFIAAFVTVLYVDLRVRKEGFDLQLLAQRIGVEPGSGALPFAPPAPPTSAQAPFWPPPPGWTPPAAGPFPAPATPQPPASPSSGEPPFSPPPPGWTPGGGPAAPPPAADPAEQPIWPPPPPPKPAGGNDTG